MADKAKKRRGRKAYLADFQPNSRGDYEYNGALYRYTTQSKSLQKALAQLWAFEALQLICTVIAGCLPAAGMDNTFYLLLPYTATLLLAVSTCWALVRLTAGGNPLREYVYQASVKKLPLRTLLTAVFAGITAVGEILRLVLHGFDGKEGATALFFMLIFTILACSIALRRLILHLSWAK